MGQVVKKVQLNLRFHWGFLSFQTRSESHHLLLQLLKQRYVALQMNVTRKRSELDVNSEGLSIIAIVKEIERDQDDEILLLLDDKQRELWNAMCGIPFPVSWPSESVSEFPFADNDGTVPK
jgi:hypothetical protein